MSWWNKATSARSAKPIELYTFTTNVTSYYYTSAAEDYEHNGILYEALPHLQRGGFEISNDALKSDLDIVMTRTSRIVSLYIAQQPEYSVKVSVASVHVNDDDLELHTIWKGHVNKCTIEGDKGTLKCVTNLTTLCRIPERRCVQTPCPYGIYSLFCGVQQDAFRLRVANAAINSLTELQHDAFAVAGGDGWFAAGWAQLDSGEIRTIVKHEGDLVTLKVPLPDQDAAIVAVTLYAGCDHLSTTCKEKFNNLLACGAFPEMPSDNVYTQSSLGV